MDDTNDPQSNRSGGTAPSDVDPHELLRTPKIPLGDIDDVAAYVASVVLTITREESEFEEFVSEGNALAYERYASLAPGESLERALSHWLESRLRDHWRKQHPEWRRNSRGATAYALPTATGLAWEHAAATTAGMPATDDAALVQSRIAFQPVFKSEQDLRDPRLVGRYLRVPSAAGLATGVAREIWATSEEEQALSDRQSFRFLKADELDKNP
jgi:hypothetical protein